MAVRSARTTLIAREIRGELLRRDWTAKDLGQRIGASADHVTNVICGAVHSKEAERRIEQELGRAFWASEEEFSARAAKGKSPEGARRLEEPPIP
jgi:hypothetical protein